MNENPFTLMFGKEPYLMIRRDHIVFKVYSDLSSALPTSQIYILIGARGAGKTVLLTEMYNTFEDEGVGSRRCEPPPQYPRRPRGPSL